MKQGRKDSTSKFGNDSEFYVSSLLMMVKNPNGTRRPDLVAMRDTFDPRLTIEMKSGRYNKGILNDSQLHYAVTLEEDYVELFGEEPPEGNGLLKGADWRGVRRGIPSQGVAYYYNVVERADELNSFDVSLPFHTIRLRWGDQFIIPHEMGFYYFAIGKARRSGKPIKEVMEGLFKIIKHDVDEKSSHYLERRDTQSWQNIYTRDIKALFYDDLSLTSRKPNGVTRIEELKKIYPEVEDLERIAIEGPNGTTIYVLAEPRHKELFVDQVAATVRVRRSTLESITVEREECEELLRRMLRPGAHLFGSNYPGVSNVNGIKVNYEAVNETELLRLKRLTEWCAEGEVPFHHYVEEVPF